MPPRLMSPIIAVPVVRALRPRRPVMDKKAWLWPEPLSPTTARVSPASSVKLRSLTARTSELRRAKVTLRSLTSSTLLMLAILWIEGIAQSVPDIGQTEQQRDQHRRGRQQQPRHDFGHRRTRRDQRAQRGLRLLHAQAEIGEEALGDDDFGNGQRGIDHHWPGQIGHD